MEQDKILSTKQEIKNEIKKQLKELQIQKIEIELQIQALRKTLKEK